MRTAIARINSSRWKTLFVLAALVTIGFGMAWLIYQYFPLGIDWRDSFKPATLKLITGHSPYEISSFRNPPWILLPLFPLALLPDKLGYAIWDTISIFIFIFVGCKFGAKFLALLFLILSYPVIFGLYYGQIDALVVLGFILPPPVGIFLLLAKPQIGLGAVIFWCVEAWREGGIHKLLELILPVTLTFLASLAIFGPWFYQSTIVLNVSAGANTSLWPLSIPIGLVLLVYCLRKRYFGLSITSSTFLTPYLGPHSWSVALLGLLPYQVEMIAASIGLWIAAGLKGWWL